MVCSIAGRGFEAVLWWISLMIRFGRAAQGLGLGVLFPLLFYRARLPVRILYAVTFLLFRML